MSEARVRLDPITAEIIASALLYASEEMGIAVRNAAYSPNIKERLDHSCALFDRDLQLVAQAEHIPVHLGSLPWGLRRTLALDRDAGETMRPGDQWVVNDPYLSGTHLNDVTVIRPIFVDGDIFGYACNKAHHTDVGGMVPGSMPPDARELFAEGFIMPPTRLDARRRRRRRQRSRCFAPTRARPRRAAATFARNSRGTSPASAACSTGRRATARPASRPPRPRRSTTGNAGCAPRCAPFPTAWWS